MASTMAAAAATIVASPAISAEPKSFSGLKANSGFFAKSAKPALSVSNGSRVSCMLVWTPYENPRFETLSYLPPLTKEQAAKQVEFIIRSGWIPCLEFDRIGGVYRKNFFGSGYADGRYWTMWKLPMFGCNDAAAVLREIDECIKAYPDCYVRILGFDSKRQVQVSGFVAYKPPNPRPISEGSNPPLTWV